MADLVKATYQVWDRSEKTANGERLKAHFVAHRDYGVSKSEGLIVAIFPLSDRHLHEEQNQRAHAFAKQLNDELVAAEAYVKLVKDK